jgi:hypothetical protein
MYRIPVDYSGPLEAKTPEPLMDPDRHLPHLHQFNVELRPIRPHWFLFPSHGRRRWSEIERHISAATTRPGTQARRARLIEMLGGKCVRCGATEDLEFDHIDPSTKVFAVCAGLSKAWDALVDEASKTQLLCKPCHIAKGAEDRSGLKHGTYHVYWYWNCRCDLCKSANARKSADLRAKKLTRRLDLPNEALGGRLELPTNRLTAGCSAD